MGENTIGTADPSVKMGENLEEMATELSKFLNSIPLPTKTRFSDDPYKPLPAVQSSSAYVTIDFNDESCGPSFSDSECSVMAGVDVGGQKRERAVEFECVEARDWFTGETADVGLNKLMTEGMWVKLFEDVFE